MEDYPETILEFEKRFAAEEACREYLARIRWPEGFYCPRCGAKEAWTMKRGLYWCSSCNYQASVTAGTMFADTRKPLQLWFRAIWYVVSQKNGVSALGLQKVLGLGSYHTAWEWLHKLRKAMVRPGRERLMGTVEVDEAYIGDKIPGKRGRGAAGKALEMVAVEDRDNKIGRIRLSRIIDASSASLLAAANKSIEDGTMVRTDGWTGYQQLSSKEYGHIVVCKDASIGDNLLPLANRVVALLKKWLQGTHQGVVRPDYLDYYLDEFTFRFNRRTSRSRGKLFYRLVQQAAAISPITGSDIHNSESVAFVKHNILGTRVKCIVQ